MIRYGYVDGENVLFTNDQASNMPLAGTYLNWGGDKAWIWPQSDWPRLIGRLFPPPPAMDGAAWTCDSITARSCRLESSVIEPWGARIERTITLDPVGTRVTWIDRLIKVDDRPPIAAAVWSVTQVPAGSAIRAHLTSPSLREPDYQLLLPDTWRSIRQDGAWLVVEGNPKGYCKMGIDSDALEVTRGAVRFTESLIGTKGGGAYKPMEEAQVYVQREPYHGRLDQPAYIELEFTSPVSQFPPDQREIGMTVQWELSKTH